MPFGGYKASGQERESIRLSIGNFCETKTVIIQVDEL